MAAMDDHEVLGQINRLADEEETLYRLGGEAGGLSETQRQRLREVEVALDQCYDLLRQRQARRAAGLDPEAAEVRPPRVVEGYEQ
jgi:hypothetical protein